MRFRGSLFARVILRGAGVFIRLLGQIGILQVVDFQPLLLFALLLVIHFGQSLESVFLDFLVEFLLNLVQLAGELQGKNRLELVLVVRGLRMHGFG